MQYKFLLAGISLVSSFTVKDLAFSAGQSFNPYSWHIKPPSFFWETGDQKNKAIDEGTLKQSNWYGEAMKNIASSEYHFKWVAAKNAYYTPNRKNNLRFTYNECGFIVEPRTTQLTIGEFDPVTRHK
ncbi:MAG TPA: hypothetical protein VHL77_01645, partial [Ferruginibacter sp.]|nr:hypothetical protein [Ferruginibacter sp.]